MSSLANSNDQAPIMVQEITFACVVQINPVPIYSASVASKFNLLES